MDTRLSTLFQVNSFWTGRPLGELERLCVLSMLKQGHKVRIFSYGDLGPLPDGVERADAEAIVPAAALLRHRKSGSPSLGSNVFRYRLMQQGLGLWLDLDMLLFRPIRMSAGPVFGWQDSSTINTAVLYLPPDSPTLAALLTFTDEPYPVPPFFRPYRQRLLRFRHAIGLPQHVTRMRWGVFGPKALTYFARQTGEAAQAAARDVYYPLHSRRAHGALMTGYDLAAHFTPETVGLHLWNEALRKKPRDLDRDIPEGKLIIDPDSFLATYAKREFGLTLRGDS